MDSAAYQQLDENDSSQHLVGSSSSGKKKQVKVSFALLVWITFFVISALAIADRFYGPVWPLGINNAPFEGGFAVRLFDVIARVSGRLSIVTTNFLFLTMCRVSWELLYPHFPSWLDTGDIRGTMTQIHYTMGLLFMTIPMLLHVWSIFFPAMAGVQLTVFSHRPSGTPFYLPPNDNVMPPTVAEVNLASNDLYRLVLMTLLFCVIFPLSVANRSRSKGFSAMIWAHLVAAFLYTIDILRQPSHPHSEIFNTPLVAYWMVDRLIGIYYFRARQATVVHKEILDGDYCVVLLKIPSQKRNPGIGSAYWFNFPDAVLEASHPFTVFQNRSGVRLFRLKEASAEGHQFSMQDGPSSKKKFVKKKGESNVTEAVDFAAEGEVVDTGDLALFDTTWSIALVVQIHSRPQSWTQRLADAVVGARLRSWGPYSTEYRSLTQKLEDLPPLVLIATGAGCAFIVDFYLYITAREVELTNQVDVFFSSNSIGLFQFFTDLTCTGNVPNWSVNAHLTRHDDVAEYEAELDQTNPQKAASSSDMAIGRASFRDIIQNAAPNSQVYFCGSPALQWECKVCCAERDLEFHEGHTFSTEGIIKFKRTKKGCLCRASKVPLPCCY